MTSSIDYLSEHIADMEMIDHHCHAPLRLPQAIAPDTLRAAFTESVLEPSQTQDVPQTIAFRAMIRWLSRLLGCDPTEHAVLQARASYLPEEYHQRLADDAHLGAFYADFLFNEARSYAPDEWSRMSRRPVRLILRIETFAERLLPAASSWDAFRHEFGESLAASLSRGVVAFKSIAAYRSGLDIEPVDWATASAAFDEVRAEIEAGTFTRLTSKALIDALVWETLEVASELSLPIQFHVGLGDDDVFLPTSDPTLMRAIFQEERYRDVPIILLHCYPYVRQAAYLASIYPNAYVDLGLTVPLASIDCAPLIREALGLAPTSKVLASTDGHTIPEFQWFAARLFRACLARVLASVVDEDLLDLSGAIEVAAMVLSANAEQVYRA